MGKRKKQTLVPTCFSIQFVILLYYNITGEMSRPYEAAIESGP